MSLRHSTFSAVRWTAASTLARALLQIVQVMVLARLLPPEDFGLMAIASAIYVIVSMFVDMGISSALIHFPRPPDSTLSTLFWLNMGSALILALLLACLAAPLSALYAEPELLPLIVLMSLALPLSALGLQFRVIAEKELRFSSLAPIEIIAALIGFTSAILIAVLGGGVYALVIPMLISAGITSVMAWWKLSVGLRPTLTFRLVESLPYLRYGAYRLGDKLCNALHSQADVLIGGAFVGAKAMGIYSVPRDQALRLSNTIVNPIVTRVGLPVLAKVQGDIEKLKSIYLQSLRMTSSINFPVYGALAIWADEVVMVLLGGQWSESSYFLRIFAIWGLIRSTGNPVGSLLYATGHVKRAFWWNLVLLLVLPSLLFVSVWSEGIQGLAWARLLIQVVLFYLAFRYLVQPVCSMRFREYLGTFFPALVAVMAAAAVAVFVLTSNQGDLWIRLAVSGVSYCTLYIAISWLINRSWVMAMLELLLPLTVALKRGNRARH